MKRRLIVGSYRQWKNDEPATGETGQAVGKIHLPPAPAEDRSLPVGLSPLVVIFTTIQARKHHDHRVRTVVLTGCTPSCALWRCGGP